MYARFHRNDNDTILAACDDDVIGQTCRGDKVKITVSEAFYGKEKVEAAELVEMMGSATILNLVGEEVIALATMVGLVSGDTVMQIGDTKHVQVVMM